MPEPQMVKVLLTSPDGRVETLWATPTGGANYRLENSPFFAYGISWNDIVAAVEDPSGQLVMTGIVEKSGHRTIRVILPEGTSGTIEDLAVWPRLVELGCSYEGYNRHYIALDFPPGADLQRAVDTLIEFGVQWEHADPTHDQFHA